MRTWGSLGPITLLSAFSKYQTLAQGLSCNLVNEITISAVKGLGPTGEMTTGTQTHACDHWFKQPLKQPEEGRESGSCLFAAQGPRHATRVSRSCQKLGVRGLCLWLVPFVRSPEHYSRFILSFSPLFKVTFYPLLAFLFYFRTPMLMTSRFLASTVQILT